MDDIPREVEALIRGAQGLCAGIDLVNRAAWECRLDDPERARRLAAWAHAAATSGAYAAEPYRLGLAASLRTQAFLHNDVGNYSEALRLSLQVLELLGDPNDDASEVRALMIDALGTMSWTYRSYGDYGAAAEYGMRAFRLAETSGDRLRQARLLNILGNIYAESNDPQTAVDMGERALAQFRELGMADGESVALNNLALTYLQQGDGARALATCQESLRIAHEKQVNAVKLTALSTLGEIYLGIGKFADAELHLRRALALSRERSARYDEFLNLLNLGKTALGRQQPAAALATFEEALTLATALSDRVGQFQAHQLLAEAHESLGEPGAALDHYKRFHGLKETVFSENATQRLAGLRVIHEVETAQRDAEIHYLRTIELNKEIEERKVAQAALEHLANLDPLTGLLNRRELFTRGEQEMQRTRAAGQPFTAIMFDIDRFKDVNDVYGHAIGDQALIHVARSVRQSLREGELIGRYGGDEFVILLPGSPSGQAEQIAERLRAMLVQKALIVSDQAVSLTLSLGIAEYRADTGGTLDALLALADQALYASKQAGRDRCTIYRVSPLV